MKTIFEETGGSYSEVSGYRLPNLMAPDAPPIGIWSRRHLRWLKRNRRVTYTNLLTTGRLYDYLKNIDAQANEQLELLIRQLAKTEGITEQLKARRSDGMGRTDEQHPCKSRGNHKQRVDILVKRSVRSESAAHSLKQQHILHVGAWAAVSAAHSSKPAV